MASPWRGLSRGRSLAIMTDVSQLIAAPAVLKAVATGLSSRKDTSSRSRRKAASAAGNSSSGRCCELYGRALSITLAAIAYAFILDLRGENIAYRRAGAGMEPRTTPSSSPSSASSASSSRASARRSDLPQRADLAATGRQSYLARLADISISGARLLDPDPPAIGSKLECRIYGRSIAAVVVRRTRDGFAVRFEESMDIRVHAIRAFYAGEYVRAYRGINAVPVGKALLLRLFG